MSELHWEILDDIRKQVLPLIKLISGKFYLAGGTALALQLGHRDSVDFDFFLEEEFDNKLLFENVTREFAGHKISKTQDEKWTLTVSIDEVIKISFFTHKYRVVKPLVASEYFNLASIEDIGCMKMLAITTRSLTKDYVDLYFILHKTALKNLLLLCKQKYPQLDRNLILKSLVFFDDVTDDPIRFKNNNEIGFEKIKTYLREVVIKN